MRKLYLNVIFLVSFSDCILGYPDPGKWVQSLSSDQPILAISKTLFKGSQIFVQASCKSPEVGNVGISWSLTESLCWEDGVRSNNGQPFPPDHFIKSPDNRTITIYIPSKSYKCPGSLVLDPMTIKGGKDPPIDVPKESSSAIEPQAPDYEKSVKTTSHPKEGQHLPVFTITKDGFYLLTIMITPDTGVDFETQIEIEMQGEHGFLSASDWPLLPFYGIMCLVYIVLGIVWLIACFCRWQDLLRIQFWIGGVIFLGMLEKAMFYGEYASLNKTGVTSLGVVLAAEWVSCAKRTLARMLVIIVNLGFGIVKPRLGAMLHRVLAVGGGYFLLACTESYIRVMPPTHDTSKKLLIASLPLALLDSLICWWILTALVQTTRTLRLRRNMVKLRLYRHFTNTLIFNVIASLIFMLYTIKAHRLAPCLTDWKELWVDDAFWHILFSIILVVIMVLWRPTNNNQRYAFTPLLDNADDDDDEEEDQFFNEAYGVKLRTHSRAGSPKLRQSNDDEEILRWVEDNIPSAGVEETLPIMDSEEEEIATRFEASKMQ